MKSVTFLLAALLSLGLVSGAQADTFGSVEPIANPDVVDTRPLLRQSLGVREAFARQLLQCGIVDQVIEALSSSRAVNTINGLNTRFDVGAGDLPAPPILPTSIRSSTAARMRPAMTTSRS